MEYQTPEVSSGIVRAPALNWRVSGILSARSGNRLNIITGRDELVSHDIYVPGQDGSALELAERIENCFPDVLGVSRANVPGASCQSPPVPDIPCSPD